MFSRGRATHQNVCFRKDPPRGKTGLQRQSVHKTCSFAARCTCVES
jgi:hypothetical protein